MTEAKRRILIRTEVFGQGFDVVVEPPIADHPLDREFDNHRGAFGYASGLRMTLGLPLIDETGEPA
jgi:hypothetical protein